MPVEKTPDNPHGWGHIEKRIVEPHYQLSPRIQIVIGDEIKVSKGPYWVSKDGVKVSLDKMKGKWQVEGIFENFCGETELDIIQIWPGGLSGSTTTIAVTGDEHPSPVIETITRRPYKIRLATSRIKRRRKVSIEATHIEPVRAQEEKEKKPVANKASLSDLAKIIEESKNE